MQHPLEGLAKQVSFFSRNLGYNLDFISDDKLDWKPAPTAKSAMEIVEHLLGAQGHLRSVIEGSDPEATKVATPKTRDEAKQALIASSDAYAAALRAIDPNTLGDMVTTRMGEMPKAFVSSMAVADTIHHHGQIAYIQTLLGDTEAHFDTSLMGR